MNPFRLAQNPVELKFCGVLLWVQSYMRGAAVSFGLRDKGGDRHAGWRLWAGLSGYVLGPVRGCVYVDLL